MMKDYFYEDGVVELAIIYQGSDTQKNYEKTKDTIEKFKDRISFDAKTIKLKDNKLIVNLEGACNKEDAQALGNALNFD